MKFISSIAQILGKPFPEDRLLGYYRNLLIITVFITLFLYVFKPFGISTVASNGFMICLGFGSMTFVGVMIYDLSIGQILKVAGFTTNWTFGKWILNIMGSMFFISIANFLFSRIILFGFIEWNLLPAMIYGTFMIGIIPVTMLGGIKLMTQERKYQTIADEINQKHGNPGRASKNQNASVLNIPVKHIKYIEALQNYVKVGYINEEGNLREQTERATLKDILKEVEETAIVQCHRSYLVNQEAITSIAGNAQGLLLSLSNCEKIIPVSRSYVPYFRR